MACVGWLGDDSSSLSAQACHPASRLPVERGRSALPPALHHHYQHRPSLQLRTHSEPKSSLTQQHSATAAASLPSPLAAIAPERPTRRSQHPPSSYDPTFLNYSNATRPRSIRRSHSNPPPESGTAHLPEEEMVLFSGRRSVTIPHHTIVHHDTSNLNIAVINAADHGKTPTLHQAFDLPGDASFSTKPNIYSLRGIHYAVRFSKLLAQDLHYTNQGRIIWPKPQGAIQTPIINAAVLVYEVTRAESLLSLPKILDALKQSLIPVILVPSRSVQYAPIRTRERDAVEERAKTLCDNIDIIHLSDSQSELQKRCVSVLLVRHVRGAQVSNSDEVERLPRPLSRHEHTEPVAVSTRRRADSKLSVQRRSINGYVNAVQSRTSSNRSSSASFDSPDGQSKLADSTLTDDTEPSSVTSSPTYRSGSTLDELVNRLLRTPFTMAEGNFAVTFLAVYRMFAPPSELLRSILHQCQQEPRRNIPHQVASRTPFSIDRCLFVIDTWIHTYPGDFARLETGGLLRTFLEEVSSMGTHSSIVERISLKLQAAQVDSDTEWLNADHKLLSEPDSGNFDATSGSTTPTNLTASALDIARLAPKPHRPLGDVQWRHFMNLEEDHVAQELVHMSHTLFKALSMRDLLRHATTSTAPTSNRYPSPLTSLTTHFNHLATWSTNLILHSTRPKHRSLTLAKLMRVARKVRQLNDYNTVAALLAGLQATATHRLRQTWELVAPEQRKDFLKLEVLMSTSRGSATYRLAWENTNASAGHVPFLAVHQRDLVVAIAGGRTFLDGLVSSNEESQAELGALEFPPQPATATTSFTTTEPSAPTTANTSFTSNTSTAASVPTASSHLVNWRKFEVIGATLLSVRAAQAVAYTSLRQNEGLRAMVLESIVEKDEEELYRRSCTLESPELVRGIAQAVAGAPGPGMAQLAGGSAMGMRGWVGRFGKSKGEW